MPTGAIHVGAGAGDVHGHGSHFLHAIYYEHGSQAVGHVGQCRHINPEPVDLLYRADGDGPRSFVGQGGEVLGAHLPTLGGHAPNLKVHVEGAGLPAQHRGQELQVAHQNVIAGAQRQRRRHQPQPVRRTFHQRDVILVGPHQPRHCFARSGVVPVEVDGEVRGRLGGPAQLRQQGTDFVQHLRIRPPHARVVEVGSARRLVPFVGGTHDIMPAVARHFVPPPLGSRPPASWVDQGDRGPRSHPAPRQPIPRSPSFVTSSSSCLL
ncbi:MAG: hypothetical protein BWY79_01898 [Actinobacteria bacterium ADurb.Bin444]|nr:MAG: hypothetical protein BWY79_01898 [Actinobacteria bacterium ADurb.Bin444]